MDAMRSTVWPKVCGRLSVCADMIRSGLPEVFGKGFISDPGEHGVRCPHTFGSIVNSAFRNCPAFGPFHISITAVQTWDGRGRRNALASPVSDRFSTQFPIRVALE